MTPFHLWIVSAALSCLVRGKSRSSRYASNLLLAAHTAAFVRGIFDMRSQFFCPVLWRGNPNSNSIALTFDDGPDPMVTENVLDLLATYRLKATFFVISARARRHPLLLTKTIQAGHTIGCHDLTHAPTSNFRRRAQLVRDISEARNIIYDITGFTPRLYRPPVGLMNPHIQPALTQLDMDCIGWSRSTREAGNRRLKKILKLDTLAGPGEIVLLHDSMPKIAYREVFLEKLEKLFASIQKKNLRAVAVNTLLNIPAYSMRFDDF